MPFYSQERHYFSHACSMTPGNVSWSVTLVIPWLYVSSGNYDDDYDLAWYKWPNTFKTNDNPITCQASCTHSYATIESCSLTNKHNSVLCINTHQWSRLSFLYQIQNRCTQFYSWKLQEDSVKNLLCSQCCQYKNLIVRTLSWKKKVELINRLNVKHDDIQE